MSLVPLTTLVSHPARAWHQTFDPAKSPSNRISSPRSALLIELARPVGCTRTAIIWLDMAELVNGGAVATNVLPTCIAAAACVAVLPLAELFAPWFGLGNGTEGAAKGPQVPPTVPYCLHCLPTDCFER